MADPFALGGKHILITGGSSGLGRFFAETLAARGASVTVAARRAEALAETVDQISSTKGLADSVVMDVTSPQSIESAFEAAERRFGPVEVVVNNAGVTSTRLALDQDEASWDKVLDTNLKGVWLVAQCAGRRMVAHGIKGSIVNIASILGLRVAGSVAPYAISKAGVVQMTKALALEWAKNAITVNAIAPTFIYTPGTAPILDEPKTRAAVLSKIPLGQFALTNDVAGAIIYLASGAGRMVTGTILVVDGGWTSQ